MNAVIFSRCRILLFLLGILLIWQAIKFFPWLQSLQATDIKQGPVPTDFIKPILVSVFYEALCPDSKNFIVKQLKPSIDKASRLFNVSLIPYGKAQTQENSKGNISFTCQHGPTECLANKVHACAISQIPDKVLQISYISCMISDNMIPEFIGESCAKELGIEWKPIFNCFNSIKGSILLKEYGVLTHNLRPQITFIPTILLDNKRHNQAAILKNFFKEACLLFKVLPKECLSLF